MSHVYNSDTQKQGKSEVQGQPWLRSGFEASVGYRRHLKTLATNTSLQMKVAALGYLYSLEKVPVAKGCLQVWKRSSIFKVRFGKPQTWDVPTRPTKQLQVGRIRQGRELFGSCDFSGPAVSLFPHGWFPECKKPTRLQGQVDELGYRRSSEARSQVPDFSHTLGFQPLPYQLHILSRTLITFQSDTRRVQPCSPSTVLFYFYLTFKRILLLLSNPKRRKDLGSLPFSSSLLCKQDYIQWLSFPLEENGYWVDERQRCPCPRSLLLVIRASSGLSNGCASLKCRLALAFYNLDC